MKHLFCKHEWKLLSETVTESKIEATMRAFGENTTRARNIPHQLCDASRKHIQTFVCEKCGKLKRFVENI